MDASRLHECARARTQELPGAGMSFPFGPDYEVYKVRGKVFLLMTELAGDPVATLNVDPDDSAFLREAHPDITPGHHMNKRHWVTVRPAGASPRGTSRRASGPGGTPARAAPPLPP